MLVQPSTLCVGHQAGGLSKLPIIVLIEISAEYHFLFLSKFDRSLQKPHIIDMPGQRKDSRNMIDHYNFMSTLRGKQVCLLTIIKSLFSVE